MTRPSAINAPERETQNRVLDLFATLGYRSLGSLHGQDNRNIRTADLTAWLQKRGVADGLIAKTLHKLEQAAAVGGVRKLYDANKAVYQLLRYGVKVAPAAGEQTQTVWLVDWRNPHNNDFAVAEEVSVKGAHDKRPDIVLYVNGLALGVLELKRSGVDVVEGIRQNIDNQKPEFIRSFFSTMQLVMAGNNTQGLRYGTVETGENYYLQWKGGNAQENPLDAALRSLCEKSCFLRMIHDFTIFDRGIKKVGRHNQYEGITAAQEFVRRREPGIIWHTQGSGKSLTMVWLAKWILENVANSRVLIITDRTELDEQIEKVFDGVAESIARSKSGAGLLQQLNSPTPALMCSLVHKFGRTATEEDYDAPDYADGFIGEIGGTGADFVPKGDIFVFVDECHRTQSGKLHAAMKKILPNALFIGFTGTPLLKADKQKSVEVFGRYIHTYTFDQAVQDGVVLDLRYEARDIGQYLSSPKKFDEWFDLKTANLSNLAKSQIRQRWATMQKLQSSEERLKQIVADILMDMETKPALISGHGNAMLVCASVYQACMVYGLFVKEGFKETAVVTSFVPTSDKLRGEGDLQTEQLFKYETYRKMLKDFFEAPDEESAMRRFDEFETLVKKRFVEEPARMKLLIVVDKLLTGFDAPSATYLYIDKKMADHNLFQAICRVNRVNGKEKEYGYIVDYQDLFKSLEQSIKDYTGGAFANYLAQDIEGLIKDRLTEGKKDLDAAWEAVKIICEPVPAPKDEAAYVAYFCGTNGESSSPEKLALRLHFYQAVAKFMGCYMELATDLAQAGYSAAEIAALQDDMDKYKKLREALRVAGADKLDTKSIDAEMRRLLNRYVKAEESKVLQNLEEWGVLDLIMANQTDQLPENIKANPELMAEVIENNVRSAIVDENPVNPKYYEKMSVLLEELIEQRKQQSIEYQEYLQKIAELVRQIKQPGSQKYPPAINTPARRALYDNIAQDAAWVVCLDAAVLQNKPDDWANSPMKTKQLLKALRPLLQEKVADEAAVIELIKQQEAYR